VGGGLSPVVAAVRNAVRGSLTGLAPGDLVLAACSGGPDSLALAAALAFVAPRAGLRAGAVTVDHGLQAGSEGRAAEVAARGRGDRGRRRRPGGGSAHGALHRA
jgi:tRNA(Ile)-lysidine synthase